MLTEDQERFHEAAVEFARRHLAGDMLSRDSEQTFDRDTWRQCADFGLMKMPIPASYGGLGLGLSDLIATMEGLGYGGRDLGLLFSIHAHMWTAIMPILAYGTEEQKATYLPKLGDGTWIAANAASEPDAGSDVFSLRTRAERRPDGYSLTGTKTFVTNAQVADLFVTYATIDPALGAAGVTGFLVDRDVPGLTVSKKIEKMGLRTSPMGEVVFEDCRVGEDKRLGRVGRGAGVFDSSMEWERGCILASCVGAMRRQLEATIAHVRQRRQFGQPVGKFQSVANRIVDMKIRLDTCRPLVYRIGALLDAGKPARMEAAIAKLHIAECFTASSLDAMRNLGGYGYMTEQEAERDVRDALGGLFYSGTSDIQRNIIARALGL
jgi:alkylation response protein AidB-like acyl-CoA dehydrogenase